MKKTDTASRGIALEILQSVLRKKQPFDDVMARHQAFAALEKRDRAFVHALVALVLRRLGQVDGVIKTCLNQKQELKASVHDILRLGVAQLLFLGTPAHAAVDTSVELAAAQNPTRPYKGLINAIMRRLTREGAQMIEKQDAARLNIPDWLWLSWRQAYGTARARNIAEAHLGEALMDISVKEDSAAWAKKLDAQLLPTGSLRLSPTMAVTELEGFAEGAWWVQDAAAALPVLLMGDIKGKSVFDLCAAPGGKAAQLACAGAQVTAVDRSAKRLERMKENFARLHLEAEIICLDALKFKPAEKADFVLLDAPCSATGTMRRHPDVQRIKTIEDVERM
ncbi:MAG TPA: MFS transporter, partial [Rhodospirillaceae bacterium]|nr:MFS transporter [Rhodospirillaceae bacterium]